MLVAGLLEDVVFTVILSLLLKVFALLLVGGLLVSVLVGVLLRGVSASLELSSVVSLSVVCVSLVSVLSVCVCVIGLLVSDSEVVSFSLLQATRAKTSANANSRDKNFFIFKISSK